MVQPSAGGSDTEVNASTSIEAKRPSLTLGQPVSQYMIANTRPNARLASMPANMIRAAGLNPSRPLVPRQQAVNAIRDADVRFEYALYGMDSFPERIRKVSEAALEESRAMELAVLANIQWPGRNTDLSALGSDVEPGMTRPGPKRLWTEIDRALAGVKDALGGTSMKELAAAYATLADATGALADALETATTEARQAG